MKIVRALSICIFLSLSVDRMDALNPHTLVSQYGHTAWRGQDGFVTDANSITQTTNGYIWLGTTRGLFRFDGAKFSPWEPLDKQHLPSKVIRYLLGARDGSLWIGTARGLSRLKGGRLTNYTTSSNDPGISEILEDHTGRIWITQYRINDRMGALCWVKEDALECYGKNDGNPALYGKGITEDSAGNIWFGCIMLCRWERGSTTTYFSEQLKDPAGEGVLHVASGPEGEMWADIDGKGPKGGVQHFFDGKWASYIIPGFDGRTVGEAQLLVDRNKTLWIGTASNGLYHVHDGLADHYGSAEGLSSDNVDALDEDREGNLWVGTGGGIDMFRDIPILSFSNAEGLTGPDVHAVLAVHGDSVWVGGRGGLHVIHSGAYSSIRKQSIPGQEVMSMFADSQGHVWLGIDERLFVYTQGRYVEVKNANGNALGRIGNVISFAEDTEGNVWALNDSSLGGNHVDLLIIRDLHVTQKLPLGISHITFLAGDRHAGIWALSTNGDLVHYVGDRIVKSVKLDKVVDTLSLDVDSSNDVWASTSNGLYRWHENQITVLDNNNTGLPCVGTSSMIQDDEGSHWLSNGCGLLRISPEEWQKWLQDPTEKLSVAVLNQLDGDHPGQLQNQPAVTKTEDGRLWFERAESVLMVDPKQASNPIPPPVHIEEVVADHKTYELLDKVALPHLRGELEIDYTALSFKIPQRVLFRYKLEGHDEDWHEAGTRRQAFYNDLGPGHYRFRVIACNNDGVWNEAGAFLDFSILPTYYQTVWFRALCAAACLLLVWLLYQFRLRQLRHQFNIGLEAQLNERMRIARDFHDTFLQTIQGSKLVADSALKQSPDPTPMRGAMQQLSVWLGRATEEGRATLNSLRTSATEKNDLAAAFHRAIEECRMNSSIEASFTVAGEVSEMHPIVRDEVYRIGYEAIRNACVHSQATNLRVELAYADDLILRVRDNGVGIDPAIVDEGKQEHFGLRGMRERARRIMAKFTINTSPGAGTDISLVVPGSIIYRTANVRGRKWPAIESLLKRMGFRSNSTES